MSIAAAIAAVLASPAVLCGQTAGHSPAATKAEDTADKSGNEVEDAWILTKIKSKFIGEDALKDSNVNVDVLNGVVVLRGTVLSDTGRTRAVAIAKDTEGVKRVDDRLAIGAAKRHETDVDRTTVAKTDANSAGHDKSAATHPGHDTKATEHAAKHPAQTTKDAAGTAGETVDDGWITTKVKSSFVGVDALDGSHIDVDTNDHVVTLHGTVPTAAARTEAVRIARSVKGVTRVSDKLTIGAAK